MQKGHPGKGPTIRKRSPTIAKSLQGPHAGPVWRPSSLTQYINGRTASREENVPTPNWGGLTIIKRNAAKCRHSLVVWRWLRVAGLSLRTEYKNPNLVTL